jgi:ribosomal protein L44E
MRSMRELGLPLRPPWAPAYVIALNQFRYRILGRTRRGRDSLLQWGDRVQQRELRHHFGAERPEVGRLTV